MSQYTTKPPSPEILKKRFWPKVNRLPDGCWEWMGSRHIQGYGQVSIHGIKYATHRLSWMIANGPIPKGKHILHRCDNPACVRPDHLWLGTHRENMHDRDRKGRNVLPQDIGIDAQFGKGSKHPQAKLSDRDVLDIRKRCANGEYQRALAREYGISQVAVHYIVKRINWSHI